MNNNTDDVDLDKMARDLNFQRKKMAKGVIIDYNNDSSELYNGLDSLANSSNSKFLPQITMSNFGFFSAQGDFSSRLPTGVNLSSSFIDSQKTQSDSNIMMENIDNFSDDCNTEYDNSVGKMSISCGSSLGTEFDNSLFRDKSMGTEFDNSLARDRSMSTVDMLLNSSSERDTFDDFSGSFDSINDISDLSSMSASSITFPKNNHFNFNGKTDREIIKHINKCIGCKKQLMTALGINDDSKKISEEKKYIEPFADDVTDRAIILPRNEKKYQNSLNSDLKNILILVLIGIFIIIILDIFIRRH